MVITSAINQVGASGRHDPGSNYAISSSYATLIGNSVRNTTDHDPPLPN